MAASSLKDHVRDIFLDQVVRAVQPESGWKVLVVDQFAMRSISACCRMFDLNDDGVVVAEDIRKSRQPLPEFDAIYLCQPTAENIDLIKADFKSEKLYAAIHVFFTDACPDALFKKLATAKIKRVMKTFKELNLNFVPSEGRVFSLDAPRGLYDAYSSHSKADNTKVAAHLASLCASLGEVPVVRYSTVTDKAGQVAAALHDRLEFLQSINPSMKPKRKQQSQIIVLDRGFDLKSPLLHELTYQAVAYDLLDIENDVYSYTFEDGIGRSQRKQVVLSEQDGLWSHFRHHHMATVFSDVTKEFEHFQSSHSIKKGKGKNATAELKQMLKAMPQHQAEMAKFSLHLELSTQINNKFTRKVEKATKKEQNLVMGEEPDGTKVRDPIGEIADLVVDRAVDLSDKLRIVMLAILVSEGLPSSDLNGMLQNGDMASKKQTVENLELLGAQVNSAKKKTRRRKKSKRPRRDYEYDLSRWTPVVKDIMEAAASGSLDLEEFPCVGEAPQIDASGDDEVVQSARKRGGWANRDKAKRKDEASSASRDDASKLIIYVVGGVSYSEMRCAYEVSNALANWDVYIGSDALVSPGEFLNKLDGLSDPAEAAVNPVVAKPQADDGLTFVRGRSRPEDMV